MSFSDELKALAHGTWSRFAADGRTPAALTAVVDAAIALAERRARDAMGHKVRPRPYRLHQGMRVVLPSAASAAHRREDRGRARSYPRFRPFGCRAANSFDAETCRTTLDGAAAPGELPIHKAAYGMQNDVQYGFRTGAFELGLCDDRLELTAAVRTALETPDAARRWIAGEDVFRDASLPARP